MPYTPIAYQNIADAQMEKLFHRANDLLADVYTMLSSRTAEPNEGRRVQLGGHTRIALHRRCDRDVRLPEGPAAWCEGRAETTVHGTSH